MIHDLLKHGTREHHARAEAAHPLMAPDLTRARYARALTALLGFHAPLERRLLAWESALPPALGLRARLRSALLVRDLTHLAPGAPAPECAALPALDSPAAAMGALYVVEGATLGAQLVRRHVAATLALGPHDGAAFVASYGDAVGPMWRAYLHALDAAVRDGSCDPAAVLAAARHTFDALADWLGARLAPRASAA